jgi:hypothetical protein
LVVHNFILVFITSSVHNFILVFITPSVTQLYLRFYYIQCAQLYLSFYYIQCAQLYLSFYYIQCAQLYLSFYYYILPYNIICVHWINNHFYFSFKSKFTKSKIVWGALPWTHWEPSDSRSNFLSVYNSKISLFQNL